ncbi:MAG: hypothetical protein AAF696_16540 [Bacteroidota bacterium]
MIETDQAKCIYIGKSKVWGINPDAQSRCKHWHSEVDIVALRMPGDDHFYPCHECYEAIHGEAPPPWPKESFESAQAILCGNCAHLMTVKTYWASNNQCPNCSHAFNPGCAKHYHHYFE